MTEYVNLEGRSVLDSDRFISETTEQKHWLLQKMECILLKTVQRNKQALENGMRTVKTEKN